MLIRIGGGREGIAEYLVHGHKQDRDLARDVLDERIILDGDLELTDAIIDGMENEGEKYLHITLSFKEDSLDIEVLRKIVEDFKVFAMSAYEGYEFNFYAEAHLPKVKSYIDKKTGDLVERKPHIHIVIPEQNMLNGQNLNPFGKVDQQTQFLEAFQEHANAKYGLASPRDNRRLEFTSESEIISRYKGDLFQGAAKELKQRILDDVLNRKITDYESFKSLLSEHGETRTRNAGRSNEYQNIKLDEPAKGINLKDYVFSREFIEMTEAEKQQFLTAEISRKYEAQQSARATAPEFEANLKEWHEVRAQELKYINSGNRKLYAAYRSASREQKKALLAERAERFYSKHRGGAATKTFNEKEPRNERPDYERIGAHRAINAQRAAALYQSGLERAGQGAPPRSISSVRNMSSVGLVHHERAAAQLLLQSNAFDRVGRDRAADSEMRRAGAGADGAHSSTEGVKRRSDSVVGQLEADEIERVRQSAASPSEYAEIKSELDASRLLAHLSRTHGVVSEKYEVTKGKDGGDRIKVGSRHLNVSDFMTKEMRLSFAEAEPILRQVYEAQKRRDVSQRQLEPRRELWETFRSSQSDWAGRKSKDFVAQRENEKARRVAIREAFQVERRIINGRQSKPSARKAALSVARMGRIAKELELRAAMRREREEVKEKYNKSYQDRYRIFLEDLASRGDEGALAELRRQREAPPQTGPNTIEGVGNSLEEDEEKAARLLRKLAYSVDRAGNVTYYLDHAKRHAQVIDSGRVVNVVSEDWQAAEIGLRLAVQKFGTDLKVEGTAQFQLRVIDVAFKSGMQVVFENERMNQELKRRRALEIEKNAGLTKTSDQPTSPKPESQRKPRGPDPDR